MTEITIEYVWSFGKVEVRDETGLEQVAKVIHDITCVGTASDGVVSDRFLTSASLSEPDAGNFDPIIPSSVDADAAQAQRRAWVGEEQIAEWEEGIAARLDEKRLCEATNPAVID